MPPILWSTDPQTNLNGRTIKDSGVFLEVEEDSMDLNYWDGADFGTIPISYEDAYSLRDVLNRVLPK